MSKTILCAGVWDLTHEGHYRLFEKARRIVGYSGRVIVLVNSDEFTKFYKGFYPAQDERTRLANVRASMQVDEAFILPSFSDQMDMLLKFAPHRKDYNSALLVLTGSDWASKDIYAQFGITEKWAEDHNIQFVFVPREKGISSSMIRAELEKSK